MSLLYVNLLPQNRNVLSHLLTPLRLFFILIVPLSGELLGCSFGSLRINPSPPPTSLSKPIRRISCRECQGVYFQAVPSSGYIYQEYSSKVRTEEQVKSCIGGERSRAQSEGAERPGRDDQGAGSWEGDHSGCRWGGNPPPTLQTYWARPSANIYQQGHQWSAIDSNNQWFGLVEGGCSLLILVCGPSPCISAPG